MKKIFLIAALAIVGTAAFGQKKNVKIAEIATWDMETPNLQRLANVFNKQW